MLDDYLFLTLFLLFSEEEKLIAISPMWSGERHGLGGRETPWVQIPVPQ